MLIKVTKKHTKNKEEDNEFAVALYISNGMYNELESILVIMSIFGKV